MNSRRTWLALLAALLLVLAACAPSDPIADPSKKPAQAGPSASGSSAVPSSASASSPGPESPLKPTASGGVPMPPPELPQPDGNITPAKGAFQSPSRNLRCTMFTGTDGKHEARCAAIEHDWAAPPRPSECLLDWGDRLDLPQGEEATFGCYNSELPPPQETVPYGQGRSLGTLVCMSEQTGMTCTDSETGHYFRLSRQQYELG